jgi:rhamnose utilization protein RhaD (predicted bifunctional aldolase and dehydrogenase)
VSLANHSEIDALIEVSARLGRNPLLVQASSGNTSLKLDGVLWIKASGKWLAHGDREQILVPLDLAEVRAGIQRQSDFRMQHSNSSQPWLMGSIETAMHAVAPLPATIHVHSVNTIVWAVQVDGPAHLADRLDGLGWKWIPYVPSGLPLAREVERAFSHSPETQILVLGNHGLVVCGESPLAAEALLMEVEDRLAIEPRRAPKPDRSLLGRLTQESEWHLPDSEAVHALSTDAISRTIFMEGILYPCQAIFLGPSAPILPPSSPLAEAAERYRDQHGVRPRFFLAGGNGVVVSESMTAAEREMLLGLAEVVQRIDVDASIRYLTQTELTNVMNAEAYRYRSLVENGEDVAVKAG